MVVLFGVGDLLHQSQLECRREHPFQWIYGWSCSSLGHWSILVAQLLAVFIYSEFIFTFFRFKVEKDLRLPFKGFEVAI